MREANLLPFSSSVDRKRQQAQSGQQERDVASVVHRSTSLLKTRRLAKSFLASLVQGVRPFTAGGVRNDYDSEGRGVTQAALF